MYATSFPLGRRIVPLLIVAVIQCTFHFTILGSAVNNTACLVVSDDAEAHSALLFADFATRGSNALHNNWKVSLLAATRSDDLVEISKSLRRENCTVVVGPGSDQKYLGNASASLDSGRIARAFSLASDKAVVDWGTLSRELADRREFPNYHRVRVANLTIATRSVMRLFQWTMVAIIRPSEGIELSIRSVVDVEAELSIDVDAEDSFVSQLEDFFLKVKCRIILVLLPDFHFSHSTVAGVASRLGLQHQRVFVFFSADDKCQVRLPGSLCVANAIDDRLWSQAHSFYRDSSQPTPLFDSTSTGWPRLLYSLSEDFETILAADALVHSMTVFGAGHTPSMLDCVQSNGTGLTGDVDFDCKGERIFAMTALYNVNPSESELVAQQSDAETQMELSDAARDLYWPGTGYGPPPSSAATASKRRGNGVIIAFIVVLCIALLAAFILALVFRQKDRSKRQAHYFESAPSAVFLFASIPNYTEIEHALGPETMKAINTNFETQVTLLAKKHEVCLVKIVDRRTAFLASLKCDSLVDFAVELQLALFATDWSFALDLEPFYRELEEIVSDRDAFDYHTRWNGLRVQIGIAAGPFQYLETSTAVDYVGDTVNIASRVCAYGALPGQILITAAARELLGTEPTERQSYSIGRAIGNRTLPGIVTLLTFYAIIPTALEARHLRLVAQLEDADHDAMLKLSDAAADFASTSFVTAESSGFSDRDTVSLASTATGPGY